MEPLPYRWPLKYPIPTLNGEEKPENRFWMRSLTNRELFSPAFNQSPDGVYVTDIAVNRWDKAQQDTIWFKRDYFGCCAIGAATTRDAERPYVYDDFVNFWFGFPDGSVASSKEAARQSPKNSRISFWTRSVLNSATTWTSSIASSSLWMWRSPPSAKLGHPHEVVMWKPGCLKRSQRRRRGINVTFRRWNMAIRHGRRV